MIDVHLASLMPASRSMENIHDTSLPDQSDSMSREDLIAELAKLRKQLNLNKVCYVLLSGV